MLVTLSTGAWRASKLHAGETKIVNETHHTDQAAKVTVKLSSHPSLIALGKLHAEARAAHYKITLPSVEDGFRLLPVGREFEHTDLMGEFGRKHETLAAEFIRDYDAERDSAPARLNGLYDPKHWPADVSRKFKFTTRYLPCPSGGTWDDWLAESAEAGKEELRARLAVALQHMRVKLSEPGAVFRNSLVGNLREILDLAGDLNFTDCPEITSLRIVAAPLTNLDTDTLRENKDAREAAAKEAARICQAFNL